MTTYNTGNPLGSSAAKDLYDNAQNFDFALNSLTQVIWLDRFGTGRRSWYGLEVMVTEAAASYGIITLSGVTFTTGATVNLNEALLNNANNTYYKWSGAFPIGGKVVPANSTPDSTGGIGPGKWLSVGDIVIREDLISDATGKGDSLVTVKQPITGAADQTQHDKNAQLINILDFAGVYGDGVRDDTVGLMSMKAAAEAGITIRIPAKTFLLTAPLSFTKPVTLLADPGARIKLTSGNYDYVIQIDLRGTNGSFWGYGSRIDGLILDGNGHAKDGLSLRGVIGGTFKNIRGTNISRTAIHEWWTQLCYYENIQCSKNIEPFTVTPVHGILADCEFGTGNDRGSSANTYVNTTIEHTSGSGICGVFMSNCVFTNGTSEGNNIGIELGHPTDVRNQSVGNTVVGMDLEVNAATDILLHKTTYANEFIGLKSGFSSPAIQVQGSYANNFIGGVTSGIDFSTSAHDNRVVGVSLLGVDSVIVDNGTRNTYEKIFNMSSGTQKESTDSYPSRSNNTVAANATVQINPFLFSYCVISASGSPINITSAAKKLDGAVMDITIHNISGNDALSINWSSEFRVAGWTSPGTGRHRSIRFVYDANYKYWTAVSMNQTDLLN